MTDRDLSLATRTRSQLTAYSSTPFSKHHYHHSAFPKLQSDHLAAEQVSLTAQLSSSDLHQVSAIEEEQHQSGQLSKTGLDLDSDAQQEDWRLKHWAVLRCWLVSLAVAGQLIVHSLGTVACSLAVALKIAAAAAAERIELELELAAVAAGNTVAAVEKTEVDLRTDLSAFELAAVHWQS